MDLTQTLLQRLKETQGDTHAQAAVTAESLLMTRPEAEREPRRAALDAAAVLRWFDASLLEKMLEITTEDARHRFEILKTFPIIEPYRRGEEELVNIHESTRLGWRKKLAGENLNRFRALSARASAYFANKHTPAGRIEWIYHLLCGDPESGATELEDLSRDWSSRARPEDYYTLAAALQELEDTHLVDCRARVWTLLIIAWGRDMRGETSQLADVAQESLRLAQEAEDQPAEAEGQCLLGDVLQAQGKLEAAQAAFDEYLAIQRIKKRIKISYRGSNASFDSPADDCRTGHFMGTSNAKPFRILALDSVKEIDALTALGRGKAVEKEILEPVRARFLNGVKAAPFVPVAVAPGSGRL